MPTQNTIAHSSIGITSASVSLSGSEKFPSPFADMSAKEAPTNLSDMFKFSEYFFNTYGTINQVARTVARYFVTDLELKGGEQDERDKLKTLFSKQLDILNFLGEVGDEYMVYGNCFISLFFPIKRVATCPRCNKVSAALDIVPFEFTVKGNEPQVLLTCGSCGYYGPFKVTDKVLRDLNKVKIKKWSPKDIKIKFHPITGEEEYYLKLDPVLTERIRSGDQFYIKNTPWEIIKACCKKTNDKDTGSYFKFNDNFVYHVTSGSLSGTNTRGWGIPPLIKQYRLCYYIALLRRFDEAIAHDYIIPTRIISPPRGGMGVTGDTLSDISAMKYRAIVSSIINRKRKDPTSVIVSPFPLEYQALGGEAKALTPKESLEFATQELLNAMGYPADLFSGSLTIQAYPTALRVFERNWGFLVQHYNRLLSWIAAKIIAQYSFSRDITVELTPVTLADDIERKALVMQAATGMDIAKTTAYSAYGYDFIEEQKKVIDEQKEVQKLQEEAMAEQEAAQMGTQGQTATQEAGVGATPGDIMDQAEQIANQLLFQTPENMRKGELIRIKHSNEQLHALVIQKMNEIRRQMESQGRAQLEQQARMQAQ